MSLTLEQLEADGCVRNPNMWIGDGWMFCAHCRTHRFHYAMSHPMANDCYEVCKVCETYTGSLKLRGNQ